MKNLCFILLGILLLTSVGSCSERKNKRLVAKVEGRWQIDALVYKDQNKQDSTISENLGLMNFEKCAYEKGQPCPFYREFEERERIGYNYVVSNDETGRSLTIVQGSEIQELLPQDYDLFGDFFVSELTSESMVLEKSLNGYLKLKMSLIE